MVFVFLIEKKIIFIIHKDKAIGRTIDICAVNINKDGIIESKFIIKIIKNNGKIKLFLIFLFVKILNSE